MLDTNADGRRELYRIDSNYPAGAAAVPAVPNGVLLCDCIDDIGFAFAIDRDHDEEIDRFNVPPGNNYLGRTRTTTEDSETDTGRRTVHITPGRCGGGEYRCHSALERCTRRSHLASGTLRPQDTNYHDGKVYQVG